MAPRLVQLLQKYNDHKDVVFICLTAEEHKSLPNIRRFLNFTGTTWLTGYGAGKTLKGFQVDYIPRVWVVGPNGKVVWNIDSDGGPDDGIEKALAMLSLQASGGR